jgi:hypothetical protein
VRNSRLPKTEDREGSNQQREFLGTEGGSERAPQVNILGATLQIAEVGTIVSLGYKP